LGIASLEETIERLLRRVDELERAGKRQASPFGKGDPKKEPKKPGRKKGGEGGRRSPRPRPEHVDDTFDVPLPDKCPDPDCQGELERVYGPSWAKTASLIERAFGIKAAASTYCRAAVRLGDRLDPTYEALKEATAASPIVYPDETGWRVGGHKRWLWVFVGVGVTVYRIAASRGGEVAAEILGDDYEGAIGRDGWSAYWRFHEALHQSCLGHLMRRAHEILKVAKRGAARFPRAVLRVFKAALTLRDRRAELTDHGFGSLRGKIAAELDRLLGWQPTYEPNRKFRNHLDREREHLLTFLDVPGLEATNWAAEQAIRPAVLARKLSGCNRTDRGARAHERIVSVARTAQQQGRDVFELFAEAFLVVGPIDLGLVPAPDG